MRRNVTTVSLTCWISSAASFSQSVLLGLKRISRWKTAQMMVPSCGLPRNAGSSEATSRLLRTVYVVWAAAARVRRGRARAPMPATAMRRVIGMGGSLVVMRAARGPCRVKPPGATAIRRGAS
ncbi:MAG: hypothetical protein WDN49_13785 [Acetobacteraceae bacterium]